MDALNEMPPMPTFVPILFLIFLLQSTLDAFVVRNNINSPRWSLVQRFQDDSTVQITDSSGFIIDEEYTRTDSTWWQIFSEDKKFSTPAKESIQSESWLPDIGAWRNVFVPEVVVEEISPPSLNEYFDGVILDQKHEKSIMKLWSQMKNRRSLKCLNNNDKARVIEALRVAYISLWGKLTSGSLEVSINRARGTAAILGELEADVDVVLSAILSDVLKEIPLDDRSKDVRYELSKRFGKDVIALSQKYNKLPTFQSRETDYTQLQSENQIQVQVQLLFGTSNFISRQPCRSNLSFFTSDAGSCVRGVQSALHSMYVA